MAASSLDNLCRSDALFRDVFAFMPAAQSCAAKSLTGRPAIWQGASRPLVCPPGMRGRVRALEIARPRIAGPATESRMALLRAIRTHSLSTLELLRKRE